MKITRLTHFILLLVGSAMFLTNSCKNKTEQTDNPDFYWVNNEIELSENSLIESKLKLETTKLQTIESELSSTGVVKAIPERFAQVASPFAGRIVKSFVTLGQDVQKGSPIFEIKSSEYFSAQQEYFSAQQELKQAEMNLKRQKDLYNHAVGVKRELEEAETDYKLKKIATDQTAASLKVFNSSSRVGMGQSLIVRSPISGRVVSSDLVVGQFIKEDHEALVTVAELSKVWISAQVKEHNLGFLEELKHITFTVDAFPSKIFEGKVINIGQLLNEETRSVDVLIETDNNQFVLKPGMYVNVTLNSLDKEEIILPAKAVFQEKENQYVFVKIGDRKYRKANVKAIGTSENNDFVRVTDGLKVGERVVIEGGIFLMGAK
ncbi:efflux RND transporter periplasmic adaptor subunit [Empedobacter sp. GD03644]|uniref:efflux RND transporter periplasmic adaptor subunit n=1 Tax=Empedobacter sp. GD03644 TaxID=2975358 RepID=UPI0024490DBB|nr:efflux RND transporter periplasmic adaptor subunit [Empedobacter sp. GD03644]MDH2207565.1 efflux RND transporter periplasmic adaptor subunit [Empedobacter sp. GD03644]